MMTTTPNPTAESVIAEAMVNAGAPLMHSRVEESVAAALRRFGLLSEGTPSEAQVEAADEIFVPHNENRDMSDAFRRGADAVYDALRARAAEIRGWESK